MSVDTMTAAEIAMVDQVLGVAPTSLWENQGKLARWAGIALSAESGVDEERCTEVVGFYLSVLARNAERLEDDDDFVPLPRYNHADIVADAYASAAAGLEGYTPAAGE